MAYQAPQVQKIFKDVDLQEVFQILSRFVNIEANAENKVTENNGTFLLQNIVSQLQKLQQRIDTLELKVKQADNESKDIKEKDKDEPV